MVVKMVCVCGNCINCLNYVCGNLKKVKAKANIALPGEPHLRAVGRHLPYGVT